MPENNINSSLLSRISYDDIVDVRQQSLFARLKRLFSTEVIVRNIGGKKLKIQDSDEIQYATDRNSLRDTFNRVRSTSYNAYTRDFALAYQAARLDLFRDYECVGPDTIIPLPDGTKPTIKELTEKYKDKPQERFYVFSYDHQSNSIKLGKAYHPRLKCKKIGYKVTFDNGQYVIGSEKHPFLMRNGEYKRVKELKVGESVMPFYQKMFYPKKQYRFLYNFSKGWQAEHKIVVEQFDRLMKSNECVHHKNFDKTNNLPDNLQIMDKFAHKSHHAKLNGDRHGKNNPFFGKKHSIESNEKRSQSLKDFLKNVDRTKEKNSNYREDLTIDILKIKATEYYKNNGNLGIWKLSENINCDYSTIQTRLKYNGYTWKSFKNEITTTLNHKISSIECIGEIDVYDVTVEKYENFACDSCFLHNTMDLDPILSAALDLFSEETTVENELGELLTIDSKNNNIKEILYNLFYDILNIEFNLSSWIRNLCKYGDFYLKLNISPKYGVYLVEPLSSYNVERIENSDPINKSYVKFQIRPVDTSQAETLEHYQIAHFRLLTDSNFNPYGRSMLEPARRVWKQLCIHQNSEIWTPDGYKQIKDITLNSTVYSYNYEKCCIEPTSVINCVNTGYKDVLEIKTKHRVLHATEDHQILVKNKNNDYIYKQVKDLIIDKNNGDSLVLPTLDSDIIFHNISVNSDLYYVKLNDIGKEYIKLNCKKNGIINRIKSLKLSHPYKQIHAFLMGNKSIPFKIFEYIKTEFNINDNMYFLHIKHSKTPSFVNKDLTFTFDDNFIRFFGFMLGDGWTTENGIGFALGIYDNINQTYISTIKKYCDSYNISYPKSNEAHPGCFIVFSKELKHIMECAGYKTGFKNKDIPNWVFKLSKKSKKEFIKGLFDADGSWKWGVIGLSNQKMITQLKHLCQQSGIMCNEVKCYKPDETVDEKGIHRFPTYKLYINFNYEYDLEFERVLSVSLYEKNSSVYDIQVESENHNFVCNGVLIHNCLLEDSMLISRIMRAPERRIFKIDVGNIPPADVDAFMEKIIAKSKKVPYIDEQTGDYNLRFNLQTSLDDYWLPVRGSDSGMSIDTLPGMEWTGIDDLEYIKTKMMAALKIPKAFLGFDEAMGGKSVLSMEDVRFSRTISKIQKMVVSQLNKIAQVHLYAQGYRDASIVDFELKLTNPSTIFEKEKMEIWASKLENAKTMWEMSDSSGPFFAKNFIYKNIFHMSDDDIMKNRATIVDDCKELWRLKSITEEGTDPANPFQKINPNQGGEEGSPEEEPGLGGGLPKSSGPGGGMGEKPPGEGEEGPPKGGEELASKPVKEVAIVEKHGESGPNYVRPSQEGKKDAHDYPFGEDPLGDMENHRKSKTTMSITPKSKKLTLERFMESDLVKNLEVFLSNKEEKKELLEETKGKSYMDEENIIDS